VIAWAKRGCSGWTAGKSGIPVRVAVFPLQRRGPGLVRDRGAALLAGGSWPALGTLMAAATLRRSRAHAARAAAVTA
jgi:hypothetical protein